MTIGAKVMKYIYLILAFIFLLSNNVYAQEPDFKLIGSVTASDGASTTQDFSGDVIADYDFVMYYIQYTDVSVSDLLHPNNAIVHLGLTAKAGGMMTDVMYEKTLPQTCFVSGGFGLTVAEYIYYDISLINQHVGGVRVNFSTEGPDYQKGQVKVTVYAANSIDDFPDFEKECVPYQIEIDHFSETLVQDTTILHKWFYGEHGWNEAWRYSYTVRVMDKNRNVVQGVLTPIPGGSFAYEHFSIFQWPLRQYKRLADLPIEEYGDTFRVMGAQNPLTGYFNQGLTEPFTNLYVVGESEVTGLANEYLHFIFVPDLNQVDSEEDYYYVYTSFTMDMDDLRSPFGADYLDWDNPALPFARNPYHTHQYTFRFIHYVDCEDQGIDEYLFDPDYWQDKDWETWRPWKDGLNEGELPGLGLDDRTRIDDKLTDMVLLFEDLRAVVDSKAPFGYITIFLSEFERIAESTDNQDLELIIKTSDLPAYNEDVSINLTEAGFNPLFEKIRIFSAWVLYGSLGLFFYSEYRRLVAGG